MRSAQVRARVLAGCGGVVGAGLIVVYGFAWLVGGAPDEEVPPGVDGLLALKAIIAGITAIALIGGAITARPAAIVWGCRLYLVDFVLLLVLYGATGDRPRTAPVDNASSSIPSGIVLIVLVIWVAFPALTMWLAARMQQTRPG